MGSHRVTQRNNLTIAQFNLKQKEILLKMRKEEFDFTIYVFEWRIKNFI